MVKIHKGANIVLAAAAACLSLTAPALAQEVWNDIKPAIFGERHIFKAAAGTVVLSSPYRSKNDSVVPISVTTDFKDGRTVKAVTFVIDENPMPVTAVFDFDRPRAGVELSANMRFNGPSPMHVVVETNDGQLHMVESYVKTTGQGACASPPVLLGEIADIGKMEFSDLTKRNPAVKATVFERRARLNIQHPNLTGLQMDQITLQYIPARYVSEIEVRQGEERLFTMKGGISLSENPQIEFSYRANGADVMDIKVVDTDGTVFTDKFPIGAGI